VAEKKLKRALPGHVAFLGGRLTGGPWAEGMKDDEGRSKKRMYNTI
jgi:hypothetical protein